MHREERRGTASAVSAVVAGLCLLAIGPRPARSADLRADVTMEHLSVTFLGDRTADASAVTLGLGLNPSGRVSIRLEVPAVRARSSQALYTRLGSSRRVLQALAQGNRVLLRQVPGTWESGLGDVRLRLASDLVGGGARLFRIAGELDVKAPTADEQSGLGTGAWDLRFGLVGERRFWSATLFTGAGYNRLGDARQVALRDVPDAFLGIESEPWRWGLLGAAWIEGNGAPVSGAGGARSALGLGLRGSGPHPWRFSATVGLSGSNREVGAPFGISLAGAPAARGTWDRTPGARPQ